MVLGDPNDKYTPDLRWPVFTHKSLAGFTRKLTLENVIPFILWYNYRARHQTGMLNIRVLRTILGRPDYFPRLKPVTNLQNQPSFARAIHATSNLSHTWAHSNPDEC